MALVKYSYDQWETEIESFFSTISLRADRRTDGQEDFRIDYEILTCFLPFLIFFLQSVLFLLSRLSLLSLLWLVIVFLSTFLGKKSWAALLYRCMKLMYICILFFLQISRTFSSLRLSLLSLLWLVIVFFQLFGQEVLKLLYRSWCMKLMYVNYFSYKFRVRVTSLSLSSLLWLLVVVIVFFYFESSIAIMCGCIYRG